MKLDISKTFFIITSKRKLEVIDKLTKLGYDATWFYPEKFSIQLRENAQNSYADAREFKDYSPSRHYEEINHNVIGAFPKKVIRACNPMLVFNEHSELNKFPKLSEDEFLDDVEIDLRISAGELRELAFNKLSEKVSKLIHSMLNEIYQMIIENNDLFEFRVPISNSFIVENEMESLKIATFKIIQDLKSFGFDVSIDELTEKSSIICIRWG